METPTNYEFEKYVCTKENLQDFNMNEFNV